MTLCGFMRQRDLWDLLVAVELNTRQGLFWFGLVGKALLWIYETDRFVGFVGSSWGGHWALVLSGAGQLRGFLEPAARVNICRGSPDKN